MKKHRGGETRGGRKREEEEKVQEEKYKEIMEFLLLFSASLFLLSDSVFIFSRPFSLTMTVPKCDFDLHNLFGQ